MMAGHESARQRLAQRRFGALALLGAVRAARVKRAPGRHVDRAGQFALDGVAHTAVARVQLGRGQRQDLRIWVQRQIKQRLRVAQLHHAARYITITRLVM